MIGRRFLLWLFGAAAVAPALPRVAVAAPSLSDALPTPRFPFVMTHPVRMFGDPAACGGVAFYLRREIKPGDLMLSADAVRLDGSPMPPMSIPTCGTCGRHFMPLTAYIRRTWLVDA